MTQYERQQVWMALMQGMYVLEGLAIGGAVVLTLWGWHLVHWLCWTMGAGAAYGYFWLIAHPRTYWLTVLIGVGMCGTAGYFVGSYIFGSTVVGWVWALVFAAMSVRSKQEIKEQIRRVMAGTA